MDNKALYSEYDDTNKADSHGETLIFTSSFTEIFAPSHQKIATLCFVQIYVQRGFKRVYEKELIVDTMRVLAIEKLRM